MRGGQRNIAIFVGKGIKLILLKLAVRVTLASSNMKSPELSAHDPLSCKPLPNRFLKIRYWWRAPVFRKRLSSRTANVSEQLTSRNSFGFKLKSKSPELTRLVASPEKFLHKLIQIQTRGQTWPLTRAGRTSIFQRLSINTNGLKHVQIVR